MTHPRTSNTNQRLLALERELSLTRRELATLRAQREALAVPPRHVRLARTYKLNEETDYPTIASQGQSGQQVFPVRFLDALFPAFSWGFTGPRQPLTDDAVEAFNATGEWLNEGALVVCLWQPPFADGAALGTLGEWWIIGAVREHHHFQMFTHTGVGTVAGGEPLSMVGSQADPFFAWGYPAQPGVFGLPNPGQKPVKQDTSQGVTGLLVAYPGTYLVSFNALVRSSDAARGDDLSLAVYTETVLVDEDLVAENSSVTPCQAHWKQGIEVDEGYLDDTPEWEHIACTAPLLSKGERVFRLRNASSFDMELAHATFSCVLLQRHPIPEGTPFVV